MPEASSNVQDGKAQFDHIYNEADPREFFRTLGELEYQIPAHGNRVFDPMVAARRQHLGRQRLVVLDLCCSYGINAALLNHDISLEGLYDHYLAPQVAELPTEALIEADRAFYAEHRRPDPVTMVGLDVADSALDYARRVGLHAAGSSEDLETAEPSADLAHQLSQVDLITVTGGIGYIGDPTFDRVLRHASARDGCWVAAFVLRWVPFEPIADVLANHGLVTEQAGGATFRQRRFADDGERDYVLAELDKLGVDPAGREAEGWHHTNLYLSWPAAQPPRG